jgi:hypothetical protein
MCWHTFDTLCSLLSSLIFIYKQHYVYLFFFFFLRLVRPAAYGFMNSQPTSTGALQECQQASFKAHKNANKLRIFCQEPSCRRLANFVWPQASLPRTTKDKPAYCCMQIINGKKIFSGTPKCHSRQSWSCDPEDSKSKPMVRARERRADGEPSLVVGRGHVSWTILSLIALTRQKQLAKSRKAASQPASQC